MGGRAGGGARGAGGGINTAGLVGSNFTRKDFPLGGATQIHSKTDKKSGMTTVSWIAPDGKTPRSMQFRPEHKQASKVFAKMLKQHGQAGYAESAASDFLKMSK